MIHSTTSYTLIKGEENITFNSEKMLANFQEQRKVQCLPAMEKNQNVKDIQL